MHAKSLQSCPTLWDPMDCSLPGSSVHRILQARKLQWVAMLSSRGSFPPRDQTHISCDSCIASWFFTTEPLWNTLCVCVCVCVCVWCPTLCDPVDYTVHGILQARILQWITVPFSRGSSQPRDRTQAGLPHYRQILQLEPSGFIYLKDNKRINLKCSHHKNEMLIVGHDGGI